MHNIKIYSILQNFSKVEQNRLKKYIISPYFNKNEALIGLFELLIHQINSPNGQPISKEKAWKKLWPETEYDDVRFRKLCSDLLKLVERFLAQEEYESHSLQQTAFLIQAAGKKQMEKLLKGVKKTASRLAQQQFHQSSAYYFNQYLIERNYYEALRLGLDRTTKSNVESILTHLDHFYIAEKLKYFCSIVARQNITAHEYQLFLTDEILNTLELIDLSHIPPIAVYHQIYLTQKETENLNHYYRLKEILDRFGAAFPSQEAREIYTYAINYCIAKINQGVNEFLEEFLDINEDLLKKGALTDGELSPWKFQNIVTAALRAGRFEWTNDFITKHKDDLPEAFRENALSYNMARLYWYQRQFDEVIELLREVEYEDVSYNLGSKSILLLTYYETDEIEPLHSLLDSFRVYLNRHKDIPANRRKNYLNLIKFTRKLTKIIPGDQSAIDKLAKEINQASGVMNEEWLREKIEALK